MSLAETQAIFDQLQRIDALLTHIEGEAGKMDAKLPERTAMLISVQQLLRVFWRLTALMKRMGLPEDVEKAINILNRIAAAAMHTWWAVNLLAKGTLYGQIAGSISLISVALTAGNMLEGY